MPKKTVAVEYTSEEMGRLIARTIGHPNAVVEYRVSGDGTVQFVKVTYEVSPEENESAPLESRYLPEPNRS